MELLNYIRHKEEGIEPSVKNSSVNCAINIITMRCLTDEGKLAAIKSPADVNDQIFHLRIDKENDYSHFEGTQLHSNHHNRNPVQNAMKVEKPLATQTKKKNVEASKSVHIKPNVQNHTTSAVPPKPATKPAKSGLTLNKK